ncbi:hypothetical protein L3Q65_25695 [Amycolatopsis sp. FU40]|uniref:hypothetical protein n=1 Tax=Amycolatopsis sp. FU40 TaxID=2914159 RepID=UPI001F2CC1AD|nr:hypothetical protein [Amycolatopsis sp. FU40]UKD51324.1 hypothetical protein L3Q65_25695 [Amycolatopsis sp. FU40]
MNVDARKVLEDTYELNLVYELLDAYGEAKRNYLLGGHRLSEVEGGRFCEAAYRILESMTIGRFTPIDGILNTEKVARKLGDLPLGSHPKSVRIYLPRALRVVYDIRNSRDAAHLADGIDPNVQDATLVVSVLDWVVAELIRLSGKVSADRAQLLVDELVTRKYPSVQVFRDKPRVIRADLKAGEVVLVLLYHAGSAGSSFRELKEWVSSTMAKNLKRTVDVLDGKALVHRSDGHVFITRAGENAVEGGRLLDLNPVENN